MMGRMRTASNTGIKIKMKYRSGLLAVLMLTSIGCLNVKLDREFPERRAYMLQVERAANRAEAPIFGTVEMRRFRSTASYDEPGFVYRASDGSYEVDFYNEFFIPPSQMVQEELGEWLATSGLFESVVEPGSRITPEYYLEGNLVSMYGDYTPEGPAEAVIELGLLLLTDGETKRPVFQKNYTERVPMRDDSPRALVDAWSEGLEQILQKFENDLRGRQKAAD